MDSAKPLTAVQEQRRHRLVLISLFGVALLNAGYNTLTKDALSKEGANALIFSLFRDACAYPILQLGALLVDGPLRPRRQDIPLFAALGLTGMFGNQFLFIEGLKYVSSNVASIISLAQAPIACSIAMAVGQERFVWRKVGGLAAAVSGAGILLAPWSLTAADSGELAGYACGLGACLSMATYYIIQKPALRRYPPLTVTAWSYFFGALTMGLASTYYAGSPTQWHLTPNAWLALLFAVLANSVGKYALQSFANAHVEATTVTAWSTAVPVFTAIFAYVDPSQRVSPLQVKYLGMLPIMAGIYLVTPKRASKQAGGAAARDDEKDGGRLGDEGAAQPLIRDVSESREHVQD